MAVLKSGKSQGIDGPRSRPKRDAAEVRSKFCIRCQYPHGPMVKTRGVGGGDIFRITHPARNLQVRFRFRLCFGLGACHARSWDHRQNEGDTSGRHWAFPVKIVVNESEENAVLALQELGHKLEATAPDHRMSALQDLQRGQRLEIDETMGHAVDEARRLGIPAPTLEMCYNLCKGINENL